MTIMLISATYVCPVKGLASLEPPEPVRLGQAARVAKGLGLERLVIPVLEEPLASATKSKVRYLDGLVRGLNQVADARLAAWLIVPARRILGVDFVAPYLVSGGRDPKAGPVFVDGRIRTLWAFDWWRDPSYVQKRIKIFHEIVDAVSGHSALSGWLVMDRALEWARPDLEVADLLLKSCLAEIRDSDERGSIYLGLDWSELLHPEMAQALARQADGLRMSGLEKEVPGLERPKDLAGELWLTAYLGTLAQWLFRRPIEIEIGWGALHKARDVEEIVRATRRLVGQGLAGMNCLSLIDPEPRLLNKPPWVLRAGLEHVGLLDYRLEPKEHVETWLREGSSGVVIDKRDDFIDISPEEYMDEPHTHLSRLWHHFRESN